MRATVTVACRVNVRIDIIDASTGRLLRRHRGHNLVVDAGLAVLAAALTGEDAEVTDIALGSGTVAVAASDVALVSEIERFSVTNVTSVDEVTTSQFYLGSSSLNGSTIREAGLFISSTMFARYVFNEPDLQPKSNVVAAVFSWDISFAAA